MASAALTLRLLLLLAVAAAAPARGAGAGRVDLWPMPASVTSGAQTLLVSKDLKLSTAGSSNSSLSVSAADAISALQAGWRLAVAVW
jgi:hexosaminidase